MRLDPMVIAKYHAHAFVMEVPAQRLIDAALEQFLKQLDSANEQQGETFL